MIEELSKLKEQMKSLHKRMDNAQTTNINTLLKEFEAYIRQTFEDKFLRLDIL